MKKFNKLVSLMLVGAMMLGMCTTAYAKNESNVKQYNSIQEVLEENESMQDLILSDENLSRPAMAPLTSMQVMWVNSQDAGEEHISAGQYATKLDHGGDWFQVITLEVGFSSVRWAKFKHMEMESTDTEYVDLNGDNIMDGVLRLWTINTSYTSGKFEYSAWSVQTSKEFSTWINVL